MMDFLSQGGYAGYVWGAFGMTFGLLLIEILQLRTSHKTTLTRMGRLLRLRAPQTSRTETGTRQEASKASG
ncbi:MAG: heme exporter protein CcmD [Lamprobacter sp.]|uniref:heme exporter protein CcmD n=1 Tax=Lamprobacter sp. TaxID=3100796 RepID=UPI002B260B17|nr:heme exporter protein CcmD [Lamprobacter sp.]MEA3639496.1 heme exporter protein CcmD [Lamprobacter sp.]